MEGNGDPTTSPPFTDVRLIVKSANQQFEDLIIHTESHWTVRKLKTHLAQVCPLNPSVPEQKLIYSGQLLSDELILKDVLRNYKDVETENHIFHLAYTPKMSFTKPFVPPRSQEQKQKPLTHEQQIPSTSDGLRRRNLASTAHTTAAQQQAPSQVPQEIPINTNTFSIPQMFGATAGGCPAGPPNYGYPIQMQFGLPGQLDGSMMAEHQAAMYNWMQQIYNNYIDQCLRMSTATLNTAQAQPQMPIVPPFLPPPSQYVPQYVPQKIPSADVTPASSHDSAIPSALPPDMDGPSTSRAAAARFTPRIIPVIPPKAQPSVIASPAASAPEVVAPSPAPAPAPAPAPPPAENIEQAQPRFPNIVQNEQENRDWLDIFYSVIRLLALLTLVYFYSSPLRCLIVALIAAGIYLYHIGFFQRQRPIQSADGNGNGNNAPAAAENVVQPQDQHDSLPRQAATNEPSNVAGDARPTSTPTPTATEPLSSSVTPPEVEPSVTSLIAFVRTFVVSFFASLLPETPAL